MPREWYDLYYTDERFEDSRDDRDRISTLGKEPGSDALGWCSCKPAFLYSHCPRPFFLALFCTVTNFGLKDPEELITSPVYGPNASKAQHGGQHGSECEVLMKQGSSPSSNMPDCSGAVLLCLYGSTAGVQQVLLNKH